MLSGPELSADRVLRGGRGVTYRWEVAQRENTQEARLSAGAVADDDQFSGGGAASADRAGSGRLPWHGRTDVPADDISGVPGVCHRGPNDVGTPPRRGGGSGRWGSDDVRDEDAGRRCRVGYGQRAEPKSLEGVPGEEGGVWEEQWRGGTCSSLGCAAMGILRGRITRAVRPPALPQRLRCLHNPRPLLVQPAARPLGGGRRGPCQVAMPSLRRRGTLSSPTSPALAGAWAGDARPEFKLADLPHGAPTTFRPGIPQASRHDANTARIRCSRSISNKQPSRFGFPAIRKGRLFAAAAGAENTGVPRLKLGVVEASRHVTLPHPVPANWRRRHLLIRPALVRSLLCSAALGRHPTGTRMQPPPLPAPED